METAFVKQYVLQCIKNKHGIYFLLHHGLNSSLFLRAKQHKPSFNYFKIAFLNSSKMYEFHLKHGNLALHNLIKLWLQ